MNFEKGQWALITGGSSGIGKAFAEALAARGLNLYVMALDSGPLSELASQWRQTHGIEVLFKAGDLTQEDCLGMFLQDTEKRKLHFSVLVNAAGFGYFGPFCEMSDEQIENMIQLNVIALAKMCRFFLKQIRPDQKGALINIASIAGTVPYPYAAVYAASKSFVSSFTRAVWAENDKKDLAIVSVCPGYTQTNFEKVSKEPGGIHLFSPEDPAEIAQKVLRHLSPGKPVFLTRSVHRLKIILAKLVPLKVFAAILRHLSKR